MMEQKNSIVQNEQITTTGGEIILYQPDSSIRLEVRMQEETVWLTQAQMTQLFQTTKQNISLHIGNIFREGELNETAAVKDFLTTAAGGGCLPRRTGFRHLHLRGGLDPFGTTTGHPKQIPVNLINHYYTTKPKKQQP